MRALEQEAVAHGLSQRQMMINAGIGLSFSVLANFLETKNKVVLGLVGSGNNGGDTLIALTDLIERGWKAVAYLVKPRPKEDEWLLRFQRKGGKIFQVELDKEYSKLEEWLGKAEVILDGILGTGAHLPLEKTVVEVLNMVSAFPFLPYIIAVDCPSGVDCDSGQAAEECIPADMTYCMEAVKAGLLRFPAFQYVGELRVISLDLPEELPTWEKVHDLAIDALLVESWMPDRPLDAHKGSFGTLMIAAGCSNFPGSVLLAGRGAYRAGVGLVRIAVPNSLPPALAGYLPEATWLMLPQKDGAFSLDSLPLLLNNLEKVNALLIGPGWSQSESVSEFLQQLLKEAQLPPLVIDADGLRHLAKITDWYKKLPKGSVLTPHPGEMSALTGMDIASIQADRMETARKFAVQWGQVVLLKGALSVVASPQGQVMVVPVATPALARAGTGDVLAGMLAAFIAQGMESFQAAAAAAWVHARAGQMAAEELFTTASVLASDVIEFIPQAISLVT